MLTGGFENLFKYHMITFCQYVLVESIFRRNFPSSPHLLGPIFISSEASLLLKFTLKAQRNRGRTYLKLNTIHFKHLIHRVLLYSIEKHLTPENTMSH